MTSLRTLTATERGWQLHARWRLDVHSRLTDIDLGLLTTLVRPAGYLPDFLVPSPPRRRVAFAAALDQVACSDVDEVARQLTHLAGHAIAQQGPGREGRVRRLHELAKSPKPGLLRIVAQLERYWRVAVAPYWSRLHALLQADIAYRLEQLADGGAEQLLATLHPSVRFEQHTLRIQKYYDTDADLDGRGLLLIPCAFAWPDVIVLTAHPSTPTVSYSPRALGRLWESPRTGPGTALADVLGRTRANLRSQLDLPMATTQIAAQLALSAPTLNVHLKAMHRAGLLNARRDGRYVLYVRTTLGDHLLNGAAPQ